MNKILISSLGTGVKKEGGYSKAKYQLNDTDKVIETTFISKALVEYLDIDKLFLIGTNGSIWDSCYKEFGGENEDVELALYEKIDNKTLNSDDLQVINRVIDSYTKTKGSKCFLIEYGINEKELWFNFEKYLKILEDIEDNDIVYIDISHSFRSLALMSFLMIQFGHIIKNKQFKIGGIYYGMFEYSFENNGITPIIDLKMLYELMEWIKAVDNFKNYSNADLIASLLEDKYEEEHKVFNNISNSMKIANMASLKKNIQSIAKKIKLLQNSENPIISLMSDEIIEFVNRLNKKDLSDFQLELAFWYFEHNNYALSYIALAEAIVSKICEKYNYSINTETGRKQGKEMLYKNHKEFHKNTYKNVNKIRNNIAHQLSQRSDVAMQDINNLRLYLEKTKKFFKTV